ncbi:hypothetical protein [Calothrix sp. NIES-3974]|uniref:hypothetical protein n=1 Tax=Calothrix sp. NIES-3974 TaxID=2005462 RepID=UPI000B612F18|nr:hypothetical protein [Calothrix sp. NIES-3974]BAZ04340.1 hypothetical protein NIES3974_09780 [Calothrix sp. NIES-3974]
MNKPLIQILFAIAGFSYFSFVSYLQLNTLWQGELILIPVQIFAVMYFWQQGQRKSLNIKKN